MSKSLKLSALALVLGGAALAQEAVPSKDGGYGIGREALPEEVSAWNIDIQPDGSGLPVGSGDVMSGEKFYVENCVACHGDFGEGVGRWPVLAGGQGTLENKDPVKTIGSYWPYLSTVYDYIHRAMPFGHSQSLTADETYALTAYVLYLNDLVDDDFSLSNENFTEVTMPNVDNFIMDDRAETELPKFQAEACMENCKESVEITMHASVVDVTPEETAAKAEAEAEAEAELDTPASDEATASDKEASTEANDGASTEETAESEPATSEEPAAPENAEAAPAEEETATDSSAEADPALIAAGETAFRQCKSCHMVGEGAKNRVGPHLNEVVGRTVGGLPDYKYSAALQEAMAAGKVWDIETLHAFLANPREAMPGTKMTYRGVRDDEDIKALIAYLESVAP